MNIFKGNIENITKKNSYYRSVLYTKRGKGAIQLVVMSLRPDESIGPEVHQTKSQFIRVEMGHGIAEIGSGKYKKRFRLKDGDAVVVPAGTRHDIINTSKTDFLKLYTIYTPPEHSDNEKNRYKTDNKPVIRHKI